MNRRVDGSLVRAARENRGESLTQVAARAGIDSETLRLIEVGATPTPRVLTLRAVADALGVDIDAITVPYAAEAASA